jgi:hypothetical protein
VQEGDESMSQQNRILPVLVCALLLGVLISAYLFAWRRFVKKDSSQKRGRVRKHSISVPAEETLKYWTAEKMRRTPGMPLPTTDALEREKPRQR